MTSLFLRIFISYEFVARISTKALSGNMLLSLQISIGGGFGALIIGILSFGTTLSSSSKIVKRFVSSGSTSLAGLLNQ